AGGLSVEILAGYNLVVDSNVTSPSTAGPSAFTPGARICNTTASPINDIVVKIGDFANNTAGIYPERGPGIGSFNTDHPALVDGGGTYAFTHEGGSQGIADATRLVGTLGPGECVVQYWTLSYPRCENVAGVADDPQCQNNAVWGSSVKPEDDLYLDFDVWATGSGGADGISSRTMYMRNEISAMANKIQPNGNLGSTWFSTDLDQVKPGSVITTNGILYRIGNVRFGFDNDGDYQPDYNFWMQPIGDASLFDTGCFRLIRTSGVITIAGGTDTSFTFEDQLYFTYPQVPTDNTNVIGEVHYTFLALGDNCAVTPTPYQEAASGYDNEKFNADYGAGGNEPFSSTPVEVTVDKNSLPSLTGPGSFVTYEIPFQNTSTTDSAGLVLSSGDVIVNTPLVISDTIPPEVEYQAGSATSSFSTSGLTATVYYSIDNGDSWTTIEPTPAISVTTIQWWLSDSLPPTEDGSATFQVFIPLDYSLPVLENCTNLQYGNGPSVTEACVTTIITGPNSIGDFVWRDEDSDGVQDGGAEVGIDAITVTLYYDADGNGQLDTSTDLLLTSTVTSGGGSYLFDNLADGNYLVVVSTDDPDLPFGYKITTDKVVVVDLDSGNASTAAVDYLDADFGFGPALSVNKTLISGSPAYQGREVQYKIQVNNLRSASGEPVGNQCVYDMWASNFAESGTDWVDESDGAITNADNIFSSLGPNGNYAVGDFGGSGDLLRADTYDVSDLNGPIVKVEALYSFYKGGTLFETSGTASDDEIYGRVYTGATQLVSNQFSNAVLNTYAGPAKQGVITFNVTSLYGAWDTSLFATLNSGLYIQKGASADGAILNIDAMGFRVTIDQPCLPDPADTLNPVPLSDNFNADLLEFVSADPPQTTVTTGGTSPYGNTGLIEWTNIGPIGAGETKEITLTFKGLDPGATGQTLTNTAVVSNAYFASGERANGGADDAVTTINPTGSISGVVWSDANNNGWQSTTGYDSSDFRIPGVTVTLYVCYDSANDLLISEANVTKNKTCSAQGTNVGWLAIDTQTTDLNGEYLFEGLLDAYYYVAVDNTSLPGGSGTQTAEASFAADGTGHNTPLDNTWGESDVNTTNLQNNSSVNIFNPINNAETITDVSFGYTVNPMLYGYIWQDFDADGVIDSNEPYLDNLTGGITVTLSTASGVVATTQTDANGYYEFPGLTAGVQYTITVDTG
ncbi:MAG: hypothetical protein KDI02_17665, partial [Anaerolineae bacterium]|nr:hypothetical protein [Anaerolineae bacterium]